MTTSTAPTTEERELLDMLRINVQHWRKTSNLRFRFMPQSLWDEVISSAQMFGVRKISTIVAFVTGCVVCRWTVDGDLGSTPCLHTLPHHISRWLRPRSRPKAVGAEGDETL